VLGPAVANGTGPPTETRHAGPHERQDDWNSTTRGTYRQCSSDHTQHVRQIFSGIETGGADGSMNRGPGLLGPRVVPQKLFCKKVIGLLLKN